MRGILQNFFDNPILTRELRRRMRGKALVYSMIGYIMLMALVTVLVLLFKMANWSSSDSQAMLEALTATGRSLFTSITIIQVLLVLIVAPTITAGMTTGEKEKKTFDFLRVTTITPWMYVLGCFLSTFFYVTLALLCALPLISIAFLYGGVGRDDVLRVVGALLGGSMILSSLGLYISSIRERTRTAQGVVVFMIFTFLFVGVALLRQIQAWLGTGTGLSSLAQGVTVFNLVIPGWMVVALGFLALTSVFLLLATRKLFEPEETRAFNHWQYALIASGIIALFLGAFRGTTVSEAAALAFVVVGCVLLMVAVGCFAVGRMEVGDEIWHLKRLLPFLRPIDQTLPFLVLVGFGWWYALAVLQFTAKAGNSPVPAPLLLSIAMVSLAGFAFFCTFARFATAITVGRKGAGRWAIGVMAFFWAAVPIFAQAFHAAFSLKDTLPGAFLQGVSRVSPIYVMVEGIGAPEMYKTLDFPMVNGLAASAFFVLLAVGFLVYGEILRYKRWRGFDYHFDMPSR
ncbi:MAG: ABC transporter permease [Sumerlaeia bacterium]